MTYLYLPFALITIIYLIYVYFTRNFNYWKKRNVKGPQPVPFYGNIMESATRKKAAGVVFKEIYESFPNEKIVGVYRMTTPCLLIRDLDIIKHIMIKDFDAFADRGIEFSKECLGMNLFHADAETWRVLRNRFTPLFTSSKLKNMLYLMTERVDKFSDHVSELCVNNPEQEMYTLVQKFTMATIAVCAFGVDIDTISDKLKILRKLDELVFTPTFVRELDMMYPGILKTINTSFFPAAVKNFFTDLVKSVISQRNGKPTNRKDFMDLILELRQAGEIEGTKRNADNKKITVELTDDIIAAQAFIFYVAGFETSATTMAFMLYQLALNPDVQDKLIAEIDEVLEKHDGKITYECIADTTYLEKVFDETLRMYSLVEPLQRNAQWDYKVPGTDVTIKKGQTVLVSPLGIHHDEKYYPNPDKFDPERFSPEISGNRHTCAYMPFGVGPRNCIGMRFSKVQSRVCIIKFLSNFRVEPSKNTPRILKINPKRSIISSEGGIYLNIVPRKHISKK